MQKRFAVLGVLVCALSMFVGVRADASYNYTTSLTVTAANNGATILNTATGATVTSASGLTVLTLSDVARSNFNVPSTNTLNIGDVAVTSTATPPGGDTFTISYTDVITITNVPPPGNAGSASVTITGILTLQNVSTGTGLVGNAFIIGGGNGNSGTEPFNVTAQNFGNLTINGASSNLGGIVNIGAVPEPASVVMLGLGIGAVGLVGLRRRIRPA